MAAGGDQHVRLLLAEDALIFALDHCCADGRLLHVGKAEPLERLAHPVDADARIVCGEGGRKADIDRRAAEQKDLCLLRLVDDLLGVLRTDDEALTAENAVLADDVRLIGGKSDGFHGAVPECTCSNSCSLIF